MRLQIECADKNGDVFIDLVDRSSPRHPKLIATMKRGFDMKENAQVIAKRVNAFEEGGLVDDVCIQLMDLYSSCVDTATPEVYGTILGLHEKLEAALAKS